MEQNIEDQLEHVRQLTGRVADHVEIIDGVEHRQTVDAPENFIEVPSAAARLDAGCHERGRVDGWLTRTDIPRRGKEALSEPGQIAYDKGLVQGLREVEAWERGES